MADRRQEPPSFVGETPCRCCGRRIHLAEALLRFLVAPPRERARMARAVERGLAAAGLHHAIVAEALDRGRPEAVDRLPELRADAAAARHRVVERAQVLLGMRAAAATLGFRM